MQSLLDPRARLQPSGRDGARRSGNGWHAAHGLRHVTVAANGPSNGGSSGSAPGGGGSVRRVTSRDLEALRKVFGPQQTAGKQQQTPQPGPGAEGGAAGAARRSAPVPSAAPPPGPGEAPLFPPPLELPSDPALSAAISAASGWRQLADLYGTSARRLDPGQMLAMAQRLAHVTGALHWPEGAPLPAPATEAPPQLTAAEEQAVVALAGNLCRATQVCLPDLYGLQQVAGLLQALVSLGVNPPPGWLRSAELVALRAQRQGADGAGGGVEGEVARPPRC
ncbi:hypothetical protein GPECTOR_1g903 [Gonium pectorale]|uniref:Uncharacterized protein n=1 Tax=Gonium pectorale TaxID=33097 RepID=A0A150H5V0_GONPE|nr:hypothetical protein GPECTOR_1g903 [Gonium pectorale]|eukprot:KXZ57000.1 hypothetical protein GPECTOR_1g903 [Gonium pectorale]